MQNNFDITTLFITKDVRIVLDDNTHFFNVRIPTIRESYENPDWVRFSYFATISMDELQKMFTIPLDSSWDFILLILFNLGQFDTYRPLYNLFLQELPHFIPDINIDTAQKTITVKGITMTSEIWNYAVDVLKLSYGEKVTLPPTFDSEEAKAFYLAQKKNEDRIRALKKKKESDREGLIKSFLAITYAFPSLTFDYLFNQTMAQIQWLQKYAAGATSYEVNAKAFAAGNMKKSSKLDFFIK